MHGKKVIYVGLVVIAQHEIILIGSEPVLLLELTYRWADAISIGQQKCVVVKDEKSFSVMLSALWL